MGRDRIPSFDRIADRDQTLEVWGSPSESLPDRPLSVTELVVLAESHYFDEIHVPPQGQELYPDAPGPTVTAAREDYISEFVVTRHGDVYLYRYGWPEVTKGDLHVPKELEIAKAHGYIRWWYSSIDIEGLRESAEEIQEDTNDGDFEVSLDPRTGCVPIEHRAAK